MGRKPYSLVALLIGLMAFGSAQPRLESFEFPSAKGHARSWKAGRVTVLNVVALWCDTWKEQNRRVAASENICKGLPVDFYTVSLDGRWQEVAGGGEDVLLDREGLVRRTFGIDRVPLLLVLDRTGALAWSQGGVVRSDDLAAAIHKVLAPQRSTEKILYLAFDDFPAVSGNDDLMDVLRANSCPATFFCIGRNISERDGAVRRAAREGHSLGLHSWSHDAKKPDLERNRTALSALGIEATLYHAPGSRVVVDLAGAPLPNPVLDPSDYRRPGKEELLRRLGAKLAPGMIIQLHAGVRDTIEALPEFIAAARRAGYRFARLER